MSITTEGSVQLQQNDICICKQANEHVQNTIKNIYYLQGFRAAITEEI